MKTAISVFFALFLTNASADDYVNHQYNFRLNYDNAWQLMPNEAIAELQSRLPAPAKHIKYTAGLMRRTSGIPFDLPYIIVQVIPSERSGISRIVTKGEFFSFVNGLRGDSLKIKELVKGLKAPEAGMINDFSASLPEAQIYVDSERRKLWTIVESPGQNNSIELTMMGMSFLQNGNVVQINAYCSRADLKLLYSEFYSIVDSVATGN